MAQDEKGREIPDPRPVEWPLGLDRPLSIQEEIQRFVRVEMSRRAVELGEESFEEADDFTVEDDDEWVSPYQLTELQEDSGPPPPFSLAKPEAPEAPAKPGLEQDLQKADEKGTVPAGEKQPPSTISKT